MSEELRAALAAALHECLPDSVDDRLHRDLDDEAEPFCEYLSHALIARLDQAGVLATPDRADLLREAARAYAEAHARLAETHGSHERAVVVERLNDLAKAALATPDRADRASTPRTETSER